MVSDFFFHYYYFLSQLIEKKVSQPVTNYIYQSNFFFPLTDQEILRRLEKDKILVFTPSRRVQGRRVVCYDDRFIVKLAYESDGIIVSNDNYRDLAVEKPEWKKFIDERLLMYSFVNDK